MATRLTAWTIGIVAWPPQVTMLTFGASRCVSPLTEGITLLTADAQLERTCLAPLDDEGREGQIFRDLER